MPSASAKANILLFLTAAIWGGAFVAQRLGMAHVGPFAFNGVRFGLGALALVPLILLMAGQRRRAAAPGLPAPGPAQYIRSGVLAGLVLFIGASLQQIGLVTTSAGNAGFITGLYVVLVPLLGLFVGQRAGLGAWAGALLAVAGMYLLSVTDGFRMAPGDVYVLVGAFFWAGHVVLLAWLAPRMDPVKLAATQFATCSVLSLAAAVAFETTTREGLAGAVPAILYGGLMSVGVAYTLQVVAQKDAKPTHAAIILSLEAVFAAAAGWAMLGEVLSTRGLVGCGLMLAGMVVSQLWP